MNTQLDNSEQLREIIVRYNARRHDKPNGFKRHDTRPPIDKAIEEIEEVIEQAVSKARIEGVEEAFNKLGWKDKNGEWGYIDIDSEEVNEAYVTLKRKSEEKRVTDRLKSLRKPERNK